MCYKSLVHFFDISCVTVAAEHKLSLVIKLTRELFVSFQPNTLTPLGVFEIQAGTTPKDFGKSLWQNMQRCSQQCHITAATGADKTEKKPTHIGGAEKCQTLRYMVALLLIKLALFKVFSCWTCWHRGAAPCIRGTQPPRWNRSWTPIRAQ